MSVVRRHPAVSVLAASGLFGFLLGLAHADWQWAVEHAQVVAGLVSYAPDHPLAVRQSKMWSVLPQVLALPLLAGVSEIVLSKIVSGIVGMVSFQALAMVVYALSRQPLVAVASVFVIYVSRIAEFGVVYPIWLLGTTHTYGMLGLSWVVLSAALLGAGWYRSGALLAGLAPAIHLALGAGLLVAAGLAAIWGFREIREHRGVCLKYLIVGAAVSGISLAVHLALSAGVAAIDRQTAARYLMAFVSFWDAHRQPVEFGMGGVKLNWAALALAVIWLTWFARDVAAPARFLLKFVAAMSLVSLDLAWLSHVPAELLPLPFVAAMPSRLLNVNAMLFAALLFGLLGAYWQQTGIRILTVALAIGLLVSGRSDLWRVMRPASEPTGGLDPLPVIAIVGMGLVLGAWRAARVGRRGAPEPTTDRGWRANTAAMAAVSVVAAMLSFSTGWRQAQKAPEIFRDRTNDGLMGMAAGGTGQLLTGGDLHLMQLRTRRPVLLDGGALDTLPYSLEAAPAVDRRLREVYGLDLFNPPAEARLKGRVPPEATRAVWESYSLEDWQQIRRVHGVTDVVTHLHWRLHLPAVSRSPEFLLYTIPE